MREEEREQDDDRRHAGSHDVWHGVRGEHVEPVAVALHRLLNAAGAAPVEPAQRQGAQVGYQALPQGGTETGVYHVAGAEAEAGEQGSDPAQRRKRDDEPGDVRGHLSPTSLVAR